MSTLSTADETVPDKSVPTDIDNQPIIFEGNPAHMDGCLEEVGRHVRRTGMFMAFFENHATSLSNGKTCLDNPVHIPFIEGKVPHAKVYSFEHPCPPGPQRLADHNAALALMTTPGTAITPHVMVAGDSASFMVSTYPITKEDRALCAYLSAIFSASDEAAELQQKADGSGLEMLKLMRAITAKATNKDKALVSNTVNNFVNGPLLGGGEMTLEAFNLHIKMFNKLNRVLPVARRKTDDDQWQMITALMYADTTVREKFDLKQEASPSTTVEDLRSSVKEFLRSRKVDAQIDEQRSGLAGSSTHHRALTVSIAAAVSAGNQTEARRLICTMAGTPGTPGTPASIGRKRLQQHVLKIKAKRSTTHGPLVI